MADLDTLLALVPDRMEALERFIADCLTAGGLWSSPRTSDGIHSIDRVIERTPDALRVCGRIWNIEQTLHTFWLEMARDGEQDRFGWFLYFDIVESSERRARNALDNHEHPDAIAWNARLAGEAWVEGEALTIVSGSTRLLAARTS